MATVYKVVRKCPINDKLFISAVDGLPPSYVLLYILGAKTKTVPGSIGIFVFEDLISAKSWYNQFHDIGNMKVLECYTDHQPRTLTRCINPISQPGVIRFGKTKDSFFKRLRKYVKLCTEISKEGFTATTVIDGSAVVPSVIPIKIAL